MLRHVVCRLGAQQSWSNTRIRYLSSRTPHDAPRPWGLWLSVTGCLGLGGYVYWEWKDSQTPLQQLQPTSALDPNNFTSFKLKKIIPYNNNTSQFIFDLPPDRAALLPVASCVLVKASDPEAFKDKKGNPIIRPYTPISPSDRPGELSFLIKKYTSGNLSKHIHSLAVGDTLLIKGPIKKWDFQINEFEQVVLIGGGSGITPLYQILIHALASKENQTRFKLIFANVSEDDILLRRELDDLAAQNSKLDVIYTLDKPDSNWKGLTGYVGKELLQSHIPPPRVGNKLKIFICGPPGQVASLAGRKDGVKQGQIGGVLQELGYSEEQVFKF